MKIVVSDTSSLILLSKASVLEKACLRYEIYIPPSVEKEACAPSLRGKHADAMRIYDLIGNKALTVRKLTARKTRMPVRLGMGEADAIRLFLQLKAQLLLTDDGKAIKACRMLKIPFTISPNLVLELYKKGDLDGNATLLSLEKLRIYGRYPPDIVAELLLKLQPEKGNA